MADPKEQPKVIDVTAPSITKHVSGITDQPDETVATDAATSPSKEAKLVSNVAPKIAPLDTTLQANGEQIVADETQSTAEITIPVDAAEQAPEAEPNKEEASAPSVPGPSSPYEASDSLPDFSEKKTTEMTNDMDSPRIYDTKEYIVPIKDTMHSHGTAGKVIAGVVSAIVVVSAVLAAAYFLV